MDDLAGLSWNSSSSSSKPPPPLKPTSPVPLNVRPSPLSSRTVSPANAGTKPPPTGDSFSNLVSFGRNKANGSNMTLQERQKQLQEQKAKEEEERRKKMDALFGGSLGGANAGFWDILETGRVSPVPAKKVDDDEGDLLAAFNAAAPVDNSSYYPPPIGSGVATPLQSVDLTPIVMVDFTNSGMGSSNNIMDPFDLDNLPSRDPSPFKPQHYSSNAFDDDDILGDLGKPVEALPPRPSPKMEEPPVPLPGNDPRDPAIAEIVDMGFTVAQAKKALSETDTGLDVTAAVGWLLEDAHRKSRPASTNPSGSRSGSQARQERSADPPRRRREDSGQPAWMRDGSGEAQEKDIGQMASQIGGTLFKSANSLWNTGKKKVGKAIAELQDGNTNDGGDANIPKWMRDARQPQFETAGSSRDSEKRERGRFSEEDMRPARPTQREKDPEPSITEEALMLEAGSGPPLRRRQEKEKLSRALSEKEQIQLQRQQAFEAAIRQKEQEMRERERPRQAPPPAASIPNSSDRRAMLSRGAVEEDSAVQYVSKNRRRPPPASSSIASSSKPATPEPPTGDLLFGGFSAPREPSRNPFLQQQQQQPQQQHQRQSHSPAPRRPTPSTTVPIVTRPSTNRPEVPISQQALQASSVSRQKGTDSFKRGDYPTALTHYTTALNPIPSQHPIRIIILSNRALCNLKIGDSLAALVDCDEALAIIGPSNGENEIITLEDGTKKDMKEFFGKTLTRKAEGYEHMEKWADALKTWTQAVEASAGGAIAISGKRRCEATLRPKPAPTPKPAAPPATARRPPPRPSQSPPGTGEAARVTALRQANAAADKVEDEKLALHDRVEDRVNAWKSGKEGNLRALLASLDTVLWEGNGWKKVGMGELLMPNKCKIAYMKGIGKVHPDKISLDATTEQKMISASVFTLLNEAWDKFKAENGL
ncbi:hypothetical protein L873DRAFT_1668898 [Choiromyces venosus 120613-1]|uniref:UBA domain-containing protein n=1 Tax=Choiromyces venosus 120613-1 TaxID=1336337 RepID=A0A3N4K0K5_9PEZI|nr:hypothetical protein L873DRAFT_1668898 [Choiromyces venosus 120613-1]